MFTDDNKIYATITSFREALVLQNDFCDWAKEWLINFNISKRKHLSILTLYHYTKLIPVPTLSTVYLIHI